MLFRVPKSMLYCEGSSTKPHRHIPYPLFIIRIWKIIMIRCGKIERSGNAFHTHNGNICWMNCGYYNATHFYFFVQQHSTFMNFFSFIFCCKKKCFTKLIKMSKKADSQIALLIDTVFFQHVSKGFFPQELFFEIKNVQGNSRLN